MSLLHGRGPQGKVGLLRGQIGTTPPIGAEQVDRVLDDKATKIQSDESKYLKKAVYLDTRHDETLDDLVAFAKRERLPKDISMVVRALFDLAAQEMGGPGGEVWRQRLVDACRETLPKKIKGIKR